MCLDELMARWRAARDAGSALAALTKPNLQARGAGSGGGGHRAAALREHRYPVVAERAGHR